MNCRMEITLRSDICVGNGESKGNAIDRDICVDELGIPYIPARRLKGCLRDTVEFLCNNGLEIDNKRITNKEITEIFGDPFGNSGNISITDAHLEGYRDLRAAIIQLKKTDKEYLRTILNAENIEECFTAIRGQTKLKEGVKVDGTLRFTRVLLQYNKLFNKDIPIKFIADVDIEDSERVEKIVEYSCKGTRHIGTSRNRGLGNVSIMLCKETDADIEIVDIKSSCNIEPGKKYELEYKIQLDSMVSIPGFNESLTMIPSSSVIGCLAGYYCSKKYDDDDRFSDLFLNGNTSWSALTPVVSNKISKPVPMFLLTLKNKEGQIINQYAKNEIEWKRFKPKTLDGRYAVRKKDGFEIVSVNTSTQYHNSISKEQLYIQDAIDKGYIYGGIVEFDGKYYDEITDMISNANLRFGRSKNIQYSNCHLLPEIKIKPVDRVMKTVSGKVYVIAESDLIIKENGLYITDEGEIREYISNRLGFNSVHVTDDSDCVKYGVVGGYHNMWHLQKMHVPVVKAGSVFCFRVENTMVQENAIIGDMIQEGYGHVSIYSEEELSRLTNNEKGKIDTKDIEAPEEAVKRIENKLTIIVARECMLRYARTFTIKNQSKIPVSRLRLMLQTSTDYQDFRNKINTIKESDVSSENEGRKRAAIKFVNSFYGDKNDIDWNVVFNNENELLNVIQSNPELMKEIELMWKYPIMEKLHAMHYEKERK